MGRQSRRDRSSAQMQTLIIYKDRKRHLPFLTPFSLCTETMPIAHVAAHRPQVGSEGSSTHRANQTSISMEKCLQVDVEGLDKPGCEPTRSTQHAASPSFLLHQIPSPHKLPQQPAFSGCIFWTFSALKTVPVMPHRVGTADCR